MFVKKKRKHSESYHIVDPVAVPPMTNAAGVGTGRGRQGVAILLTGRSHAEYDLLPTLTAGPARLK